MCLRRRLYSGCGRKNKVILPLEQVSAIRFVRAASSVYARGRCVDEPRCVYDAREPRLFPCFDICGNNGNRNSTHGSPPSALLRWIPAGRCSCFLLLLYHKRNSTATKMSIFGGRKGRRPCAVYGLSFVFVQVSSSPKTFCAGGRVLSCDRRMMRRNDQTFVGVACSGSYHVCDVFIE